MSEYKVTLVFAGVRSGLTKAEFDNMLYRKTEHAAFGWYIDEFEELNGSLDKTAECDCE